MLACPTMVTKLNGGGAPLVSAGDTPFASGRLFPVVYMPHCRGADWSSLRSYPVVWKALDMWFLVLVDDVLMDIFSFSSTFVRSLSAL
ncbi:hypothetical protein YC2023_068365 [Brassica napus]